MNEQQIKDSFKQFFLNAKPHIKNTYGLFIKIFDERPKNFLDMSREFIEQQAQNNPDQDGSI